MNPQDTDAVGLSDYRPRPLVHFTADHGWINDPHSVSWVKDRYHLFYQAIPDRVLWAPNCQWGHAESVDLVHWTERPIALTPQGFEVGCWSGSFIMDAQTPTILYTRITGDDWGQGKVAIAHGDPTATYWITGVDDVVIDGPPAELGVRLFRDPYVFRNDKGWTMVLGAGLNDGSGAALQYRSTDLSVWTYDGVLCSRPNNREDDVWSGALWECPQLFPLGGRWVLLISVWDDDVLHYVVGAVGDYDGTTFKPDTWQRLSYGNSAYAMSSFLDSSGERCALSWLREEPQNNPDLSRRSGAHSIAATLHLGADGLLSLSPHAAFEPVLGNVVTGQRTQQGTVYHVESIAADLQADTVDLREIIISDGPMVRARIVLDDATGNLIVERHSFGVEIMPLPPGAPAQIRLILDADVLEIFTAASYGAYRLDSSFGRSHITVALVGEAGVRARVRPVISEAESLPETNDR